MVEPVLDDREYFRVNPPCKKKRRCDQDVGGSILARFLLTDYLVKFFFYIVSYHLGNQKSAFVTRLKS